MSWYKSVRTPADIGIFNSLAELNEYTNNNPGMAVIGSCASVLGVQYTYGDGGWAVGAASNSSSEYGDVVLMGDSITMCYGSFALQAMQKISKRVVGNYGAAGKKIQEMVNYLPQAIATGARYVTMCVGTNNYLEDQRLWFGEYDALFLALRNSGMIPLITTNPPSGAGTRFDRNVAQAFAAKKYGFPIYDPWSQFVIANRPQGWATGKTIADDFTHPLRSIRTVVATTFADQIQKEIFDPMPVKSQFDGLLANPVFNSDSNSDGISDSWTQYVTNGSPTYSRTSYGSTGLFTQNIALDFTGGGSNAILISEVLTASKPSYWLVKGKISGTFPDSDSGFGLTADARISAKCDGVSRIGNTSFSGGGDSESQYIFGPYTTLQVTLILESNIALAGVFTASFSEIGVANLTALGIM